jgi:hypothetical protein
MNSLYFGASFAPRIEQAASQIQDSSDLFDFSNMAQPSANLVIVAPLTGDFTAAQGHARRVAMLNAIFQRKTTLNVRKNFNPSQRPRR